MNKLYYFEVLGCDRFGIAIDTGYGILEYSAYQASESYYHYELHETWEEFKCTQVMGDFDKYAILVELGEAL